ncbi:hypothetical protein [Rhodococcoides fascians]|uniref:hypothetical protein n=1 Tax=Rhodococcoides fascians TaxID=1828 RepID=UPI00050C23AA|nr:hypothetical protein [Rhodococcus fascians]
MTPEDIAKIVSNNPTLLTILGVLLIAGYVLKILSQASETSAKLLGPLGKRWREQGNRAARRADARRSEDEKRRKEDNEVIRDLKARLEYFVAQVEDLKAHGKEKEAAYEVKDDYLTYDAEWHALNKIHAAENGHEFLPPEHMSFNEFRRRSSGWVDR